MITVRKSQESVPHFAPNIKTARFGITIGLIEIFREISLCTPTQLCFLSLADLTQRWSARLQEQTLGVQSKVSHNISKSSMV